MQLIRGSSPPCESAAMVRGAGVNFLQRRSVRRFFGAVVGTSLLVLMATLPSRADSLDAGSPDNQSSASPLENYFGDWFTRVSKTQAEQPHWITPLATVTPRLEEEIRYDQLWENLPAGKTLMKLRRREGAGAYPGGTRRTHHRRAGLGI